MSLFKSFSLLPIQEDIASLDPPDHEIFLLDPLIWPILYSSHLNLPLIIYNQTIIWLLISQKLWIGRKSENIS